MGIKNLNKFFALHLKNPLTIKDISTNSLKDKVIAIDSSIYLYKFICAIKNNCTDLYSVDGQVITHIQAILTKLFSLLKRKIKPIFVFDGKPPEAKNDVSQARSEKKSVAKSKIDKCRIRISEIRKIMKTPPESTEDIEHYKRLFTEFMEMRNTLKKALKSNAGFSTDQSEDCKELLKVIGIPYINSLEEADPQCSYLVKSGLAFAVASEDMDILTFGADKLITSLTSKDVCKIYDLKLILIDLEITYSQFVDICILLKCDYTCTIRGLGLKNILSQIKKHKNIEGIIATGKYTISEDFNYIIARKMFIESKIIPHENKIKWNAPNYVALKELLQQKYSYTDDEIGRLSNVLKGGYYSVISGGKTAETYQKDCVNFRQSRRPNVSFESDEE